MKKIVLASASPRRRELLEQIGLTFEIHPAHGEEQITKVKPREMVEELSVQKALEVAEQICCQRENMENVQKDSQKNRQKNKQKNKRKDNNTGSGQEENDKSQENSHEMLVIGSDTIVALGDKIMGKPANQAEAVEMLEKLSGNTHQVYTGVTAILCCDKEKIVKTFSEKTEVTFYPITKEEIERYVATGEPMDKAGAYGIQGIGGKFVKEIHGDYNNVVGLPVARLYQEILKEWMN